MIKHAGLTHCWLCRSFGHLTCVLQPTVAQRLSITAGIISCAQRHGFQHPPDAHVNGSEGHWVKEGVFPVRVGPCRYKINSGYSTHPIVTCPTTSTCFKLQNKHCSAWSRHAAARMQTACCAIKMNKKLWTLVEDVVDVPWDSWKTSTFGRFGQKHGQREQMEKRQQMLV